MMSEEKVNIDAAIYELEKLDTVMAITPLVLMKILLAMKCNPSEGKEGLIPLELYRVKEQILAYAPSYSPVSAQILAKHLCTVFGTKEMPSELEICRIIDKHGLHGSIDTVEATAKAITKLFKGDK